jgi:hypothetical protein
VACTESSGPEKLILRNFLSPGDIVMLTAAVRDLHRCYPGRFVTDVRTPSPELWLNNPYLTTLDEKDPTVRILDCEYPLIHQSNQRPYHFIHAFIAFINEKLGLEIRPTEFRGDIHLSEEEKSWPSQVEEICGDDRPFWLVSAGGKQDFTNKWWDPRRYQEVVDHFQGRILFVQVGLPDHHHPPLEGVIDLRGCTNLRHLVRLVYHAQGVLCPVTSLMHLAAAVPIRGRYSEWEGNGTGGNCSEGKDNRNGECEGGRESGNPSSKLQAPNGDGGNDASDDAADRSVRAPVSNGLLTPTLSCPSGRPPGGEGDRGEQAPEQRIGRTRPCVVVAGGREPTHWEAYPNHQFIHTIGALPCCQTGGCWKSRVRPLGDGDVKDRPEDLCVNVVGDLPKCMDMITADEVIRRIELYFDGGAVAYLGPEYPPIAEHFLNGIASC